MSRWVSSLPAKGFLVAATALAGLAVAPATAVATPVAEPALVHATEQNNCKLNVREGAGISTRILTTLTCDNYTTCAQAQEGQPPCSPFVVGEKYSCVGSDGKQATDDKWAEVKWRAPERAYVAVACAAFRK